MVQINNGFKSYYYITEDGTVYNKNRGIYLNSNNGGKNAYKLICIDGTSKVISIKELYKIVFNKVFCIDEIENLEGEEWRAIEGTNNLYLISNKGRVKSLCGYRAKILKTAKNEGGYDRVNILIDGRRVNMLVSRLVGFAFLMQPTSEHIHLHHIDGNKLNNCAENLIWLRPDDHRKIHEQMEQEKKDAAAAQEETENVSK